MALPERWLCRVYAVCDEFYSAALVAETYVRLLARRRVDERGGGLMDATMMQVGGAFLVLWMLGLAFLWNVLRSDRPILRLRNGFLIDVLMLGNIGTLLLGLGLVIIGTGVVG